VHSLLRVFTRSTVSTHRWYSTMLVIDKQNITASALHLLYEIIERDDTTYVPLESKYVVNASDPLEGPVLTSKDGGKVVKGSKAVYQEFITSRPTHKDLLGSDENEGKEVHKWLDNYDNNLFSLLKANDKQTNATLHKLNKELLSRVFLISNHLTVADVTFFVALHPLLSAWDDKEMTIFMNITRWFDHIQHLPEVSKKVSTIKIKTTVTQQPQASKSEAVKEVEAKNEKQEGKEAQKHPKEVKETPKQQSQEKGNAEKPRETKEKPEKPQEVPSTKPAGKGQEPKKGKGAQQPAKDETKLSEKEDISRFDIRVGKILTCKRHEAAEFLYVEEIDVGEEAPRQVVSGLVKFIPLNEMTGKRVALLCNLKPSNLKGVKSHAMVLAASNEDHTQVELVEPPEGAKIGERVIFEGFPGDPEKTLKKETLESVLPDLKSNEHLLATYKGAIFKTSAGPCKVKSIANGHIK